MKLLLIIIAILSISNLYCKDAKELIRKGNKDYENKKFNEAEINYRKSLEMDSKSHKAIFNLGDALYKQEQFDKAAQEFTSIANGKHDEQTISKAFHNLGNSLLKSEKYEESIDAYKKSLKLNPKDNDTKYNLEYAKMMMQKQQQQQQQNKQNKNQQNQDKQQQQQQQQQQQNQDNKENKDKKQPQQQQQKQQEQKISQKDAERMLQALNQEEKKLQDKRKKKAVGVKGKVEKEW